MEKHWEHFEHKADIGVRGVADSLSQAFEQAALAMTAVISNPKYIKSCHSIEIDCECDDIELLFYDWLNAIIYEMAIRKMLFSEFHVTIKNNHLTAIISGDYLNPRKHQPTVEVKGATFTQLSVKQHVDGKWVAQCIVDV